MGAHFFCSLSKDACSADCMATVVGDRYTQDDRSTPAMLLRRKRCAVFEQCVTFEPCIAPGQKEMCGIRAMHGSNATHCSRSKGGVRYSSNAWFECHALLPVRGGVRYSSRALLSVKGGARFECSALLPVWRYRKFGSSYYRNTSVTYHIATIEQYNRQSAGGCCKFSYS